MIYDDKQAWQDLNTHFPNMTIRYIFILKKGPAWTAEETPEINALQEAHLANYRHLAEIGKLIVTGPFLDSFATSGEVRGMGVLRADSFEEANQLISSDPMVKVNRLVYELHAWMIDKELLR
jgi:uncharacterized protein